MGGQTALNLCLKQMKSLARFRVRMIGVDVNAINITEKQLLKNWSTICACRNMYFYLRGKEIAQEFGFL
jgi:hypothetical protein